MAWRNSLEPAVPRRFAVTDEGSHTALERLIDHRFANAALLRAALTHPGSGEPTRGPITYERLEFLGDRVLGLVIAELLMRRHPTEAEGSLTRRLVALVQRAALLEVARSLGLDRFIRAAGLAGSKEQETALADGAEALIGALYLDGGLPAATRFIERSWAPLLASATKPARDPKTSLQEWAQARRRALPIYDVLSQEGPAHEPVFTVRASLGDLSSATGSGASKREAEQAAATALLTALKSHD